MSIEVITTFLVAITLITITPGVDMMLVIRNTARGGFQDGVVSSFGICCGLFVHATVSAAGVSIILLQSAWAFSVLKIVGAGYLIWLGITSWKSVLQNQQTLAFKEENTACCKLRRRQSFREGFFCNVLNPKAVMFYMAFLPQFIDPNRSVYLQFLILAGVHFIIAMIWQSFLASVVNKAKNWMLSSNVNRIFNGITGSVMVYLGIRLSLEEVPK